jgi:hypothetical protein
MEWRRRWAWYARKVDEEEEERKCAEMSGQKEKKWEAAASERRALTGGGGGEKSRGGRQTGSSWGVPCDEGGKARERRVREEHVFRLLPTTDEAEKGSARRADEGRQLRLVIRTCFPV